MVGILNKFAVRYSLVRLNSKTIGYPRQIQIEPTNRCNLRCVMCPRITDGNDNIVRDMSYGEFIRILYQIPTLERIQLSGLGEPLLNKDITKMIITAKRKNIFVSTITNGTVFSNDAFIKKLVGSGLDYIKISLDSPVKEKYFAIRGFDLGKVVDNLKRLVKERNKINSKLLIGLNPILMRDNIEDIEGFYKLADDIGIDFISFKRLNPNSPERKYYDKDFEEYFSKKVHEAFNFLGRYKVESTLKTVLGYSQQPERCYSPWFECYINSKGNVKLCCEFYHDSTLTIGNIFDEDFRKIWNNERYRSIRELARDKKLLDPVCMNCNRNFISSNIENRINKFKKNKILGVFIR